MNRIRVLCHSVIKFLQFDNYCREVIGITEDSKPFGDLKDYMCLWSGI